MATYDGTSIWLRAMSADPADADAAAKERLRVAYRQFWGNAVTLSREIQKDLPNLTLHDEAHFDALWDRADQIVGDDYDLSPLEVFVLGGAILLHDAANAVAAFPNGLNEIKVTPEWRDAEVEWRELHGVGAEAMLPPSGEGAVLFETLRALHAQRAETIASMQLDVAGNRFHLLPDEQLRAHLGGLIGLVAASHHWNISSLTDRLPDRRGALSRMPSHWIIRPVLLACLLRCADATQLDQQRAPDFLYGLLKLRGVSEAHWRAQNRLATPLVDPEDPHALRFTSTMPFAEEDADAWWIAFDAIQVANNELQSADSLLRDLRLSAFALNRIRGAETPERLAAHVNTVGWRPVAAEIQASRVDKIVDMFGGEKLYGHHPSVPLRELIQNAADAVRFRRELEPSGSPYEGAIIIRLDSNDEGTSTQRLSVEDDGLGMSEAVLTGPLIDFGSSYISSSLVKAERPGLLSKGRKRLGVFGIGFFSCFMIAENVSVTSRPFDRGLDHCRTLRFKNGIVARPLLLENRPDDFSASSSTRVVLEIPPERLDELLTAGATWNQKGARISLERLVGSLCPMLDVDVFVEVSGKRSHVHTRRWMDEDRLKWLKRLRLPSTGAEDERDGEMREAAPLLRFVDPDDPSAGLACITGMGGAGVATVGTLKATPSFGNEYRSDFTGAIDFHPSDPKRSEGKARAEHRLPIWATEQAALLASTGIQFPQRQYAAQRVATFEGDATPIAGLLLNRKWASLSEIFGFLASGESLYAPLKPDMHDKGHLLLTVIRERHTGFVDSYWPGELELLVPTLEGADSSGNDNLYRVPTDIDPAPYGCCALLTRLALDRGHLIEGEIIDRVEFARYIGKPSERDGLMPGKVIATWGLKLTARKL